MSFLLDTCVISELRKASADRNVVRWIRSTDEMRMYISVVTLGEIQKGISRLDEGRVQGALQSWLEGDLSARFAGRILTIDADTALWWGRLLGTAERQGSPLPVMDAFIAATAKRHDLTVVTRNTQDFARLQVKVSNPWHR